MKSILLASLVLFTFLGLYSCNKKSETSRANTEKTSFVSARSFVGTPKQFEEYQKLFLTQNEFPHKMTDEQYADYVNTVNSPAFQKQYFDMQKETRNPNKQREWLDGEELKIETKASCPTCHNAFGYYPSCNKGYILGTDHPSSSGTSLFPTGHIGIIHECGYVIEAMPDNGVRRTYTDWGRDRYPGWAVYGLKVGAGLTQWHYDQAADWAYRQEYKPYNWNFLYTSTRDSFYCSQLAYAAYRDLWNVRITTISADWLIITPASLFNSNNTIQVYER